MERQKSALYRNSVLKCEQVPSPTISALNRDNTLNRDITVPLSSHFSVISCALFFGLASVEGAEEVEESLSDALLEACEVEVTGKS